jgi:predicted secreted protein
VAARRRLGVWLTTAAVLAIVAGAALLVVRGHDGVRRLDAGDDGRVELDTGRQVVLTLRGNPTTGCVGEMAKIDEEVVSPAGSPDNHRDSSAIGTGGTYAFRFDAIGTGGTYAFRFDAIGPGETAVRLVYQRPGEQGEPAGTFTFTAVVQ